MKWKHCAGKSGGTMNFIISRLARYTCVPLMNTGGSNSATGVIVPVFPATIPPVLEVRGETFLTRQQFVVINQRQEAMGEEAYANPRQ